MNKYIGFIVRAIPNIIVHYGGIVWHSKRKNKISRIRRYQYNRKFIQSIDRNLHVDLILEGFDKLPSVQSYLLCPNHQSFMDALCLIDAMNQPICYVAKKESMHYPVVERIIYSLDSIYIDRDNLRQEIKTMQQVKTEMQTINKKWVIFPEGTRSKDVDHKMGEFKAGAFKPAMSAKVNIYPVAMWGSFRILDRKVKNLKRFPVYVSVLEPLTPKDYENKTTTEVASILQERVQKKVLELKKYDEETLFKYQKGKRV